MEVPSWHNAPERKAKTEIKLIALKQAILLSIFALGHLHIHLYTGHLSLSLFQVIVILIFIFVSDNLYLYFLSCVAGDFRCRLINIRLKIATKKVSDSSWKCQFNTPFNSKKASKISGT